MSTVETVQGNVDASALGVTLIHEHLRFRDEAGAIEPETSAFIAELRQKGLVEG